MIRTIEPEVGEQVIADATRQDDGCWITAIPGNSVNGYAYVGGTLAHRAAWVFANGRQIKPRYVIDHLCFERLCVNPEHLRELTRRENSMRKTGDAWPLGTCKWGHPDSDRISLNWASRKVRTECASCRREVNTTWTQIKSALLHLERHYGITLTKRQKAMVAEFMPELLEEQAA